MEDNLILLKSVLRQWKIIFASTILMAVLMIALTMNIQREYESTAKLYTGIATGEGITGARSDLQSQFISFDNLTTMIMSRESLKEVGLRLLALHIGLQHPDEKILSGENFENVKRMIPPEIQQLAGETDSITYHKLNEIADTDYFLGILINSPHMPYYSIPMLSSVTLGRVGFSDHFGMSYKSNDAGVSQKTLEIMIDVCIRNHSKMREIQIDKKLAYFEEEHRAAQAKLKRAEAKEEEFRKIHNIADLPTQTGIAISDRQELDRMISEERQRMSAAQAAMRQIETQMGSGGQSMRRTDILLKTEQLSRLMTQLTNAEMRGASSSQITQLRMQLEQVKADLGNDYAESMSSTGTTSDAVATEYLARQLTYEESKARMRALEAQRNTTAVQFDKYLPLQDSLRRIQREIEISEKEWTAALEERNKARREQQDQLSFSHIQVSDKPNFPLTGQSKRMMMLIMGTMIGFVIPSSIFLGLAYLNNNIQTPQRAEEMTGLKSAGIMPNVKKFEDYKYPELISNGLVDTILKSLYMTHQRWSGQMRILTISTRPEEGKTLISNMLCERLISKGRKCLIVMPYIEAGDWSMVSYKVDKSFYQSRAEDIVPVERMNDAEILIIELPSLIMNDYPVELIRQFDMAFLVCKANREWVKADQTALESFITISGIRPQIILNEVNTDIVEQILGKIS